MSNIRQNALNNASKQQTTTATQEAPSYIDQLLESDYFSYIWKVGLAVIVFFVLFMATKWIAGLASRKFFEHASITDLNKQESTGQLVYDVVFYVLLIVAVFIAFEIV